MDELLKKIEQFNIDRNWDQFHSPNNLAKSIMIEAGELLEHYQFNSEGDSTDEIQEEIADVMMYCLMLCQKLNLDPIQIMNDKLAKNIAKYPAEKVYGSSRKYNEY